MISYIATLLTKDNGPLVIYLAIYRYVNHLTNLNQFTQQELLLQIVKKLTALIAPLVAAQKMQLILAFSDTGQYLAILR